MDPLIEGPEDRIGRIDWFATEPDAVEQFQKSAARDLAATNPAAVNRKEAVIHLT